jgi:fructose-1,6-bisphosphatase/inositol monophosphatase family enzyme
MIPTAKALFPFLEEAGRIALAKQRRIGSWRKGDGTPASEADLEIGRLAHAFFSERRDLGAEALVLDEESFDAGDGEVPPDLLDPDSLAVILDPIGGTLSYINGSPLFGTYVAVLRGLEIVASAVYLPALRELYYADGEGARFLAEPFSASSVPLDLRTEERQEDPEGLLYVNSSDLTVTGAWMKPNCFGVASMWPLAGRGVGSIMKGKAWDILAPLHITGFTSFSLVELGNGEELSVPELLRSPGASRHVLLSRPENAEALRSRVRRA